MNGNVLYVLTDGKNNYIRYDVGKNQYVKARGQFVAERWDSRSEARNVLKNSVPKNLRKKFKVIEIEDDRVPNTTNTSPMMPVEKKIDKIVSPIPPVTYIQTRENKSTNDNDNNNDNNQLNINNVFNVADCSNPELRDAVVDVLFKNLQDRKSELFDALSVVDRKICDVLHYIEFNRLNACDGYKIYKTLREFRLERRKIKDECEMLDDVYNSIRNVVSQSISRLENRKYKPRELPELFNKD